MALKIRMKIGIDCRMIGSNFTGIGHYIENLVKELSQIDSENEYILFMNSPEYENFKTKKSNFKKVLVNTKIYSLAEQLNFAVELYKNKLDLVHFPHFNAPILYFKKNIVTIHDVTLNTHAKNKIKKIAYKLSFYINCLKAKKIICVSNFTKKELEKQIKTAAKKTETIYEGCFFEQRVKQDQNQKPYIFYAGNWKSHKNIENLILAFEILKSQCKYKGQLKLTGSVSPDHPKPGELIEKSKYKKDIIVNGRVEKQALAKLFANADVYVQPSLVEGFGLPVLEAFYHNTKVACSKTGSLPEVGGKAAIYFNPKDPQDMAHKIDLVLSKKLDTKQIEAEMKKQLKFFNFTKMATETLKIYNHV